MTHSSSSGSPFGARASERQQLLTLFDLAHQVTSLLDQDELFAKIQELLGRLIPYDAFAVYLLQPATSELRIAYPFGYPEGITENFRLRIGEGIVGTAVADQRPLLIPDLSVEPRYKGLVPGMRTALVVPIVYKTRVIGAFNILSRHANAFDETDLPVLGQFAAAVGVALEHARLFETERRTIDTLETLAEIGHELASILDLDELLTRMGQLVKRVINYRTFGVLLLDDENRLCVQAHVAFGEACTQRTFALSEGLVGYAALHGEPVIVGDVSKDPRYVPCLEDVRSEVVVPLKLKDRVIGVLDVASAELDAFSHQDVQILTPLANFAAVAIENARLYEAVAANEQRLERELRFAQRVQLALLPQELPKRLRGVDVAARFDAARELGGDFHDFLTPEPNGLVVAVGDVSGKGAPAALYSAFAGELVRGRTYRRRYTSVQSSPSGVLAAMNNILHERGLEEYYCTLCYASFDFKRRLVTLANSGLPYPIRCTAEGSRPIELPGVPLGSFAGTTYDEASYPLAAGDVFVICSDGISEAMNEAGEEFTAARLLEVVERTRHGSAKQIVDAIMDAVDAFRGAADQNDDMTAVAIRITA